MHKPTPVPHNPGEQLLASVPMVQTRAGLIVPKDAVHPDAQPTVTPKDQDGRRRVVLQTDDVKRIDRALIVLRDVGMAMVIICNPTQKHADGTPGCGQPMQKEGDHVDPGYGCKCTRIHLQPNGPHVPPIHHR